MSMLSGAASASTPGPAAPKPGALQAADAGPAPSANDLWLETNWRSLKVDAMGNRQSGKWTVLPNGAQVSPNATSSDCISGYTCWFQNAGFTGWIQRYRDVQQTYIGGAYDNQMSSWINRNTKDAAWYPNQSNSNPGTQHCMPRNVQVSQVLAGEDNTMSGFQIFNAGVTCV